MNRLHLFILLLFLQTEVACSGAALSPLYRARLMMNDRVRDKLMARTFSE